MVADEIKRDKKYGGKRAVSAAPKVVTSQAKHTQLPPAFIHTPPKPVDNPVDNV
jgi:hypothetical protein